MRDSGSTVHVCGMDVPILVADVPEHGAVWPLRVAWDARRFPGYAVWRDVFEGQMKCSLADAIWTHTQACFVCESDAVEYAEWHNKGRK